MRNNGRDFQRYSAVCTAFVTLLSLLVPASGNASPENGFVPDATGPGSLLLGRPSDYRVATRINTEVEINVSGLTLHASVRQKFRNDGMDWVEGTYAFPLPETAALNGMRLTVGDRVIEGVIQEKAIAKQAYDEAKAEGRRASLVRQQRANLFTTSVANIGPGETITVEISYVDTIRYEDGAFSLRFPMTVTPRYLPGPVGEDLQAGNIPADGDRIAGARLLAPPMAPASSDHRVTLDAHINAGLPLAVVASRYHAVEVSDRPPVTHVRLSGPTVSMDRDFELVWRPAAGRSPQAMLFSETVGAEPHLLLMLMPPTERDGAAAMPPRELVFVIDTSGSMHGESIEQARSSLLRALDGLRPVDRFNVLQFNSVTEALFTGSEPATPERIAEARRFVRALSANGGTEMRPAIDAALDGAPRDGYLKQIVFITDGSVGNEDELFDTIERRLSTARLFTVGIGSAPNGWFMRKAAEAGRGTFVTIGSLHEVEEKMARLVRKLERPAVTDIELDWPDGMQVDSYPNTVPDLYAGEPVVVTARLSRLPQAGEDIRISGRRGQSEWQADLRLDGADFGSGTAVVWARARIDELMDRERRGGDAEKLRAAIVDTGIRYWLVSKYTSLVGIDRTPARSASAKLASEQLPNLLPQGQQAGMVTGFPATATLGARYRRDGSLLLALGAVLLLVRVWRLEGPRYERR